MGKSYENLKENLSIKYSKYIIGMIGGIQLSIVDIENCHQKIN